MMAYIGFAVVLVLGMAVMWIGYAVATTNIVYPGAQWQDWALALGFIGAGCLIVYFAFHFAPFDLAVLFNPLLWRM